MSEEAASSENQAELRRPEQRSPNLRDRWGMENEGLYKNGISTRHRSVVLPSCFRFGFMRRLRMSFLQKGRQTFPQAIICRGGLVKQALLRLALQNSP
jgi:hypothetical protein